MPTADETEIQQLMRELTEAWNRGDVNAYGARYRADGTFNQREWRFLRRARRI